MFSRKVGKIFLRLSTPPPFSYVSSRLKEGAAVTTAVRGFVPVYLKRGCEGEGKKRIDRGEQREKAASVERQIGQGGGGVLRVIDSALLKTTTRRRD